MYSTVFSDVSKENNVQTVQCSRRNFKPNKYFCLFLRCWDQKPFNVEGSYGEGILDHVTSVHRIPGQSWTQGQWCCTSKKSGPNLYSNLHYIRWVTTLDGHLVWCKHSDVHYTVILILPVGKVYHSNPITLTPILLFIYYIPVNISPGAYG